MPGQNATGNQNKITITNRQKTFSHARLRACLNSAILSKGICGDSNKGATSSHPFVFPSFVWAINHRKYMSSKFPKSEPIKLAPLISKQKKPAKPVAAPAKTSCADSSETKSKHGNSTLHELLKNTEPRNIPKEVRKQFKDLSKNAINGMIRETSDAVKSAQWPDKRIQEVTLKALQDLLKKKQQKLI